MAIALALVLLLILLARWLLTHFFAASRAPATSRAVRVLGRTSLAPRQQVLLLQVGRRVVVVGESNGNLATLAQLEDPDEVAQLIGQLQEEQIARAASFGGMFGRVQKKFEEDHAARGTSDSSEREDDAAAAPDAQQMKSELSGLVEKVRSIRSQLRP
jgi:flagellar protein FliO/FliZ